MRFYLIELQRGKKEFEAEEETTTVYGCHDAKRTCFEGFPHHEVQLQAENMSDFFSKRPAQEGQSTSGCAIRKPIYFVFVCVFCCNTMTRVVHSLTGSWRL